MRRILGLLTVLVALGAAGCASSDDEPTSAERPEASTDSTTDEQASEDPEAPAEPSETPPGPAAPDASPYVVGFGDLSVLSFPAGDPGELSVIATGARDELSDSVTVIVRNNTSEPIGNIEATGAARDSAGALVGSGSSQGFKPVVVAPGEIAYGYVYFDGGYPEGSTFDIDVTGAEVDTYFRPITITELNNTGDAIVGGVVNDTGVDVTGPISVAVLCFAPDGTTLGSQNAYTEQSDLAEGATGTFSVDLYGDECPIGLAAASGYGSL